MLEHGFSRSVTESLFICIRVIRVIRTVLSVHLHPCDPWADLFCTDLTDTTDIFARTRIFTECHGILFICIRVFPCVPCSLFYSNTESHGFSRNFIHLHPSNPCDPWADLFCTDLMDTTDILFICIRVFPCVPCSLFYSNTESHGFSRSLIHLHPSNPCDPYSSLRSSASV